MIIIPGTLQTPATYNSLTGDWVFQTTPASGPAQFVSMAGYVDQDQPSGGKSDVAAAFQLQGPGHCYTGATLVPWFGDAESTTFHFYSFDVNGQFITVTATINSAKTAMTGTYSIGGGCADGASGTITGTRYAALNGTYTGNSQTAGAIRLLLSESTTGTGKGNFLITGSATFGGNSCFSSGTLGATSSTVLGNAVTLDFTTNEASQSHIVLSGTMDTAASALTISSMRINGGNCAGNLGGATLQRQ